MTTSEYLFNISYGQLQYAKKVSNYQKIGKGGLFIWKVRLVLLNKFVAIMNKYLATVPEIDLTDAQQKKCMTHINNILKTNYWL